MNPLRSKWLRVLAVLALCAGAPLHVRAQNEAPAPPPGAPPAGPPPGSAPEAAQSEAGGPPRTPPPPSFTHGAASFLRNRAPAGTPAQVNTPLGEGDQLYTGDAANLEVQIGSRAFVRAGEQTQLGLTNLEPDFMQFRIVNGHASLDLRSVKAGTTVEIDTPHAAF